MFKRHSMNRGKSKRLFSHTAGNSRVHPKNRSGSSVMRGGIRL